jgi:hypothetical protein
MLRRALAGAELDDIRRRAERLARHGGGSGLARPKARGARL